MNHAARLVLLALVALFTTSCASMQRDPSIMRDHTTVSTDWTSIHYRDAGNGDTTLVFVHGWTGDVSVWDSAMRAFAPNFRVVAIDLAGHGSSERNRKDWSVENFAEDICAVVHTLNLNHVVLIGHSMSGAITVAAANKLGNRVEALIPVDTLLDAEWDMPEETWKQFFDGLRADFPTNVESFVRTRLVAPTSPKDVIDRVVAKARLADPETHVAMLERSRTYDLKNGLKALRVPIHAINSDLGPTNLETNRKYAKQFDVEIISGVGHWPHLEAPQRFEAALDKVLRQLAERKRIQPFTFALATPAR